ncbi:MAG: hypothetical protein K8E24_003660 [Methanobacterium paludis]|nr:hypothetical protein [Methanobacterium paludis]
MKTVDKVKMLTPFAPLILIFVLMILRPYYLFPVGGDTDFHLARAMEILQNPIQGLFWDNITYYPMGRPIWHQPLFHVVYAFVWYLGGVRFAQSFMCIIQVLLTVGVASWIANKRYGVFAGFFAGFFALFIPAPSTLIAAIPATYVPILAVLTIYYMPQNKKKAFITSLLALWTHMVALISFIPLFLVDNYKDKKNLKIVALLLPSWLFWVGYWVYFSNRLVTGGIFYSFTHPKFISVYPTSYAFLIFLSILLLGTIGLYLLYKLDNKQFKLYITYILTVVGFSLFGFNGDFLRSLEFIALPLAILSGLTVQTDFILFNLIYYFRGLNSQKKRNVLKNMVLGLFVFFVIGGLWAGTISEKYGELTIGTSGAYNQELVSPGSQGHPMYYQGLLKPPNNSAVSVWEDPSSFKMESWSPFQSVNYFEYQLNLIWKNILSVINILEFFSLLSLIIIIASILFIWKSNSERALKTKLIYLLVTILIYSGGYCFILVEWRYLWLVCFLLMFTGAYLIDIYFRNRSFNVNIRNILMVLLVFSFMIIPVNSLIQNADLGEGVYHLSQSLGNDYGIHGNIVSNGEWEGTLHISYYLNSKYYGITKNTTDINDLQKQLENNNIDYYFVWDKNDTLQFSDYKEITGGKITGLKIYSRIHH